MRFWLLGLALVFGCLGPSPASGMFRMFETRQVPIGRLFTNLEQWIKNAWDDARAGRNPIHERSCIRGGRNHR
jgi:hypothetical protein